MKTPILKSTLFTWPSPNEQDKKKIQVRLTLATTLKPTKHKHNEHDDTTQQSAKTKQHGAKSNSRISLLQ